MSKACDNEELRKIIDLWVLGKTPRTIAEEVGRTENAIEVLIRKVKGDYTEDGTRASLITKLMNATASSTLDPSRSPTKWDRKRFVLMHNRGSDRSRSLVDIAIVLNLPMAMVEKVYKDSGLYVPPRKGLGL